MIIDNSLRWDRHCSATYNKCQQRLYCLRKLRSFNIDNTILSRFYKSFIQSVLTFSFICWFGNVRQKDKNNVQRIVNISSKVTGTKQTTLTVLYEKQVLRKSARILADNTHILHEEYVLLPSSTWFRTVTCKTNRKRLSFIPVYVRLLNDTSLSNVASEPVLCACSYTADIYYKVACVCVFFSSVYMLLFTTFYYDAILNVMRRPQLGFSIYYHFYVLELACNYVFLVSYFMNVAHKFPLMGK